MNRRTNAKEFNKYRAPLATAVVLASIGFMLAPAGLSQPAGTASPEPAAESTMASGKEETTSSDYKRDSQKDRLTAAFEHIKNVQPDKAIICLTPLLVHAANSNWKKPVTRKLLARYYCLLGRMLAVDDNCVASAQAQKIATLLDPDNEDASLYSTYLLLRIGRDDQAQPLLEASIKKAPSNLLAARQSALCLFREDRVNLAVTLLQNALKLKGAQNDWRIHQMLGRGYLRQGYTKRAIEELRTASKQANPYTSALLRATINSIDRKKPEQEQCLRDAARILPDDPVWQTNLAILYSTTTAQAAESLFKKALEERRLCIKSYVAYGNYENNLKRREQAERCLHHLELLVPWSEQTFNFKASLLANEQNNGGAIACYRAALKLHPHVASSYIVLADFLASHKMPEEALPILQRCAEIIPDVPAVWRRLGDAYILSKNWAKAAECYTKALSLTPQDHTGFNELALNELASINAGLAVCLYNTNDKKSAVEHAQTYNRFKFIPELPWYLKMIPITPGRIELSKMSAKEKACYSCALMADALSAKHQQEDCVKEYRNAVALNPDDVDLHTYLLEALTESGDWMGAAREDFETSNRMVQKMPDGIRHFFNQDTPSKTPQKP